MGLILAFEGLLAIDVQARGGAIVPLAAGELLRPPVGLLGHLARWAAVNMTVLCWGAYLLVLDGALVWLAGWTREPELASVRRRPNRCVTACLLSVPIWCLFDWTNFYLLDAWRYHGLPDARSSRLVGYLFAFATICPAMFLTAQVLWGVGFSRLATPGDTPRQRRVNHAAAWLLVAGVNVALAGGSAALLRWGPWGEVAPVGVGATLALLLGPGLAVLLWKRCPYLTSAAFGASFVGWALVVRNPVACMTLWVGVFYLLDPVNRVLGASSLLEDWLSGKWGRTAALMVGGLWCGFLWEFWNYWAVAKWTYHLPFLGHFEGFRYFEMPWLGLAGFPPFALECWALFTAGVAVLDRAGIRIAEGMGGDQVF